MNDTPHDGKVAWLIFVVALVSYHAIFSHYFPNVAGYIGHDYKLTLPAYYDGLLWFESNDLWSVPWFTPSFCGAQPFFADPQSSYYSLTQWLLFFLEPVIGLYVALLILASISYWGFYRLTRDLFLCSAWSAALAGTFFMFNDFLSHRWIAGHTGFQAFVLVPWLALLLLQPKEIPLGPMRFGGNALFSGLMLAYGIQSGLGSVVLPAGLSVFVIACIYGLQGHSLTEFFLRSVIAAVIALCLSSAKLLAGFAFMKSFPRSDYLLPGLDGILPALEIAVRAVTLSSESTFARANGFLANVQWSLYPHEWAYGLTPIPLLLALVAGLVVLRSRGSEPSGAVAWRRFSGVALTFVLLLPIVLNVYTPDWNAVLKQVPLIKSNSSLVRWYIIYIPLIVLLAAIFSDRIEIFRNRQHWLVLPALLATLLIHAFSDRDYYVAEGATYNPAPAVVAWQQVKLNGVPEITNVGIVVGSGTTQLRSNDLVFAGISQALCYNPVFGYGLEFFPLEPLGGGPVRFITDTVFNLKNPACYVFPAENQCAPGDHFTTSQLAEMEALINYQPYPFSISPAQQLANSVSSISLMVAALLTMLTVCWQLAAWLASLSAVREARG